LDKKQERLQKYISDCGEASRRKAEEFIASGRIKVNGEVAHIGQSITPGKDKVTLDGKAVLRPHGKTYIALNKPRGYITTLNDDLGRRCVTELVEGIGSRVYPVGRLDMGSEGLLILTDDGVFANALTHPKHHVPKVYRVSVRPGVTGAQITQIEKGIEIEGRLTAPAQAQVVSHDVDKSVIEITLFEGRNRQIRHMCESLGLKIARLSRVAVGNLRLGGLRSGQWRELDPKEVSSLLRLSGAIKSDKKEDKP
jgi:23S rRNA pseudouridine2605 synthase